MKKSFTKLAALPAVALMAFAAPSAFAADVSAQREPLTDAALAKLPATSPTVAWLKYPAGTRKDVILPMKDPQSCVALLRGAAGMDRSKPAEAGCDIGALKGAVQYNGSTNSFTVDKRAYSIGNRTP